MLWGTTLAAQMTQTANQRREIVHQILYGERPVTVDQSYIDQLHAALATARDASAHNYAACDQFQTRRLSGKKRPASSAMRRCTGGTRSLPPQRLRPRPCARKTPFCETKTPLREENAVLLARLKERNPDLAEEQAAHDETFKEKQSLQRFRVIAASLIDALLAGRADRPEFAELLRSPRTPPTPSNAAIYSLLFVTSRKKTTDFVASPTLCKSPDFPRGVRATFHHDELRSPRSHHDEAPLPDRPRPRSDRPRRLRTRQPSHPRRVTQRSPLPRSAIPGTTHMPPTDRLTPSGDRPSTTCSKPS